MPSSMRAKTELQVGVMTSPRFSVAEAFQLWDPKKTPGPGNEPVWLYTIVDVGQAGTERLSSVTLGMGRHKVFSIHMRSTNIGLFREEIIGSAPRDRSAKLSLQFEWW